MSGGTVSRTIIIGHLGKDPEMKGTGEKTFAVFSVATSESWKEEDGTRKEVTDWHNIAVFAKPLVQFAEHHLKKGMKVYIEGANKTRSWEKDGKKLYATDVVLRGFNCRLESLEKLEGSGAGRGPSGEDDYGQTRDRGEAPSGTAPADTGDIPF